MTVRLTFGGWLVGVLQLGHVLAGITQFSAYGNVSRQVIIPSRNNSDESSGSGRAMSSGSHRNIFDALNMKPGDSEIIEDSNTKPKFIVYPPLPANQAMAADRSIPGEAYGGTIYKILKAKHEKRKGYQYQKPKPGSSDGSKKIPSKPPPTPSSTPSPPVFSLTPPPPPPPPPPSPTPSPAPPSSTAASITAPVVPAQITPPTPSPILEGPTPLPSTIPEKSSDAPDDSPVIQYIPPSDPNLFAPNIHSHYPPPPANGETRFKGITSYLPPPAGPATDDSSEDSKQPDSPPSNQYIPPAELFQFPPNIHSHYHPPPTGNNIHTNGLTSYLPPPAGPSDTYLPPPGPPSSPDPADDTIGTIPVGPDTAYPGYLPPSDPQSPAPPVPKPEIAMPPPKDMMTMPPNPPMEFHGYNYNHPHDHFPEYFFDHHHYHDHHHDEPPPTTTVPPPPPPPAKTKSYTYYYISRVFWYFPLYFSLYYAIYLVIIIGRSLARYKVDYPNRLTGVVPALGWDKIVTRSLDDMHFITNEQAAHKADLMALFVMKQIEDFKEKYIG